MKKLLLSLVLLCLAAGVRAQDFAAPLRDTYMAFDTTMDAAAKTAASNKLVLIAKKYPDAWQAQYYAAYSRANLSFFEKDETRRDALIDEAEGYLESTVQTLGQPNDETQVLAAMIAQARMSVKPQARYQKYGKIFDDALEAAKALNADNPRIYYLRGTSKYYTPKMFGGGAKAALPYFEKAAELFGKQAPDADPAQTIVWGSNATQYFLKEIAGAKD